ncbi:hypothetical protein F2P79_007570 [Pimephales promelas]|nr:hypothetical protein F2P79_007570 [Pimephales promelas]
MTHRSVKLAVNINQNSWTLSDDDKLRMAVKLPAITKGLVDNRNHRPQLSVNTQRKKEELLQLTQGKQWTNQPIMTQESDHRRDRKMVSSPMKKQQSTLLPMRDWEEQRQENMHQQMLMKAKAAVDTKGPKTFPHITGNRKKVQLQKESKIAEENQQNRQRILMLESDFRRERWEAEWGKVQQWRDHCRRFPRGETNKQDLSSMKPSTLLPMRDWEEQRQENMHQQKLMKAKAAVDTKGPKTFPHITGNRKKVQLQKEKKIAEENQQNRQRILMLESDFRRERWEAEWGKVQQWRDHCRRFPRGETNKQDLSPTKPSTLLPMRDWEEQRQENMHQQKLMKAKAAVDTKGPKTLPLIRGIRTKVQVSD